MGYTGKRKKCPQGRPVKQLLRGSTEGDRGTPSAKSVHRAACWGLVVAVAEAENNILSHPCGADAGENEDET